MKCQLANRTESTRIRLWSALGLAAWTAFILALELWRRNGGPTVTLCHLRRLTGIPCPTCGSTRAAFAFLEGRPLEAFAHNPLLVISGAGLGLWLGWRLVARRRPGQWLSARQRQCVPWLVVLAVALNWAYVLARELGR